MLSTDAARTLALRSIARHRSTTVRVSLLVFVAVLTAALPPARVTAADEPPVVAADSFSRASTGGWGSADVGGAYSYNGALGSFSVNGSTAHISLPKAGASRGAFLADGAARDTDSLVRVDFPARPTGGSVWAYAVARRTSNNEYRPKLLVNPNGAISVHAGAFVNGAESPVAPVRSAGASLPSTGGSIWLRSSVTGATPTTINVKAWLDGTPEPSAWQFSGTSSTPVLQAGGRPGLRAYISSVTNVPFVVRFDELVVRSLDAPVAPQAAFEWQQESGSLRVDFTDESLNAPTEWLWDFGDGATSTDQNPTHVYTQDGSYTVSLMVTGAGGTDSETRTVDVAPLPPPPPPPPPVTTIAADDFDRADSTWGAAGHGGLYSYQGTVANFTLDGERGLLRLPNAGATRGAFLFSPLVLDASMTFAVSTDKAAAGGSIYTYGVLRRATDGSSYRAKLRFAPNGAVYAHASRFVSNAESSLGPEVRVDGLVHAAGLVIRVRADLVGSSPTTVRVRAWADGDPEPTAWHFTASDSTAKLQAPGAVGLLAHLAAGSGNAPVSVRFDDLLVTSDAPVDRVQGETIVGAGDIAACNSRGDEATARLLDYLPGRVFAAGDVVYPDGTEADFTNCYEPSWGRHRARTVPAVGNHEYHTAGAAPYFAYFGAAAGDPGKGYYAFDLGTWRVYVLNSNCAFVSCAAGSPQEQWLRAELAADASACTLAMWHHPRYSSGSEHGSTPSVQPLWQAMYDVGAEIVVAGHDHNYERFAPMAANGTLDTTGGLRSFVVGTGGASLRPTLAAPVANSEVRQATASGVLRLVLGDGEYEWEFIPIAGQTFTDRGSGSCH